MTAIRNILRSIGLVYDSDIDTTPTPNVTMTKRTVTKKEDTPADMTYTPVTGLAYVHIADVDNDNDKIVHDWTRWTGGQGQRHGHVTEADKDTMTKSGLKEDKYNLLKPIWATGASAADAARQLRGKRGFSIRTIEKYWAAFNSTISGEG